MTRDAWELLALIEQHAREARAALADEHELDVRVAVLQLGAAAGELVHLVNDW